ncbi:MAG: formyltransferase family protein [Steroidobacteraceae bacterium]
MAALERRIRVVFIGGADLEPGAKRFIALIEAHPDIDVVFGLCEGRGSAFAELVRRRGILAVPVRALVLLGECVAFLRRPREWLHLRRLAARAATKFLRAPDLNAPAVLERLRASTPDLGVIYGGPILKPELFRIPALGTIGIHHGRAPQYRGKKTTFWEMHNGETHAGVMIQRITEGLDTGEILRQGAVPIGRKSYARVWREVQEEGCRLFVEAILDVKRDRAQFTPQAGARGPLYRQPAPRTLIGFWLQRWFRRPHPTAPR